MIAATIASTIASTLSLMLCSVVIGTALAIGATFAHAGERAAQRPVRWIWAAMMIGTVLLTALVPLRDRLSPPVQRLQLTEVASTRPRAQGNVSANLWDRVAQFRHGVARAAAAPVRWSLDAATSLPTASHRLAFALWGVASFTAFVALAGAYRRVRRASTAWTLSRVLDTTVRLSADAGPAVIGIRPMEIVVPSWILERPEREQRLVLEHESEHVRAGDPILLVAACVMVALMPWNPLLWFGLARLRLAVEIDCDARVLGRGASTSQYGHLLLELSQHHSTLAAASPALAYSTSHLERRLLAMTARHARFTTARRLGGGAIAMIALLAACESKLPTSAEIDGMDARDATVRAASIPGIDTMRATYTIDDKAVSKEYAQGFAAGSIASVEVVKGADRTPLIRLKSRAGSDTLTLVASRYRIMSDSVAGVGGAIRLRSKVAGASADTSGIAKIVAARPQRSKEPFDGLWVLDGKIVSADAANRISPNSIGSIEVIKGVAATNLYSDPRAARGVIVITSKR